MKGGSLSALRRLFMARAPRERWLLLCTGWALLAWLGLTIFEATLQARLLQLRADNEQLHRTLTERKKSSDELNDMIATLSLAEYQQQIEQLKQHLTQLDDKVQDRLNSLVGPEQMAELLLDVLAQENGLQLVQLQNRPARAMATPTGGSLYRHEISLQLRGSYTQLLSYVRRLESLQGKLYWQELEFELEQYPDARIRLDFFTLSDHKELLRG